MHRKQVNIIYNNDKRSLNTLDALTKKLIAAGFNFSTKFSDDALFNICIGGDGAFLRAVHSTDFSGIPFIGINTGHLGFFQEIDPSELDMLVESLASESYTIEEMDLIEAEIITTSGNFHVLAVNEFAVKGLANKVIHIDVHIDGIMFEKISGDGIIVSSPIGSTAYNYSCGGSIVSPHLKTIQITPIAPITSKAYRSLNNSLIIPDSTPVSVKPEHIDEVILVIADGLQFNYDEILEIKFSFSERKLNKLTLREKSFWSNVREKFL